MERILVKRGLNRLVLLPLVLSGLYAVVLLWQMNRMMSGSNWVLHTSQVMMLASETQRHIQHQESVLRGFLISHAPRFANDFRSEEPTIDSLFQQMHVQTLDNPAQTNRIDSAMQDYWTWQSSARNSLAAALESMGSTITGISDAQQDSSLLYRADLVEAMHLVFRRINDEEARLYEQRVRKFQHSSSILILGIAAASVVIGLIIGLNTRRQTKRFIDRFSAAIDETTRNRDLLETTLLSIGDGIIVTDARGNISLMNLRAEELTGWTKQEATGRMVGEVFKVKDESGKATIDDTTATVLRENRMVEPKGRWILHSRLGVTYPIEQTAAPVHDSKQQIIGTVLVFRDVSELRESEQQAAQREREFRALVENSPDVIVRYAPDLTILYANPAIEQVLGIAPQTLIGRSFKDVGIPADTYEPWETSIRKVFESGRSVSMEVQYRTVRGLRTFHTRIVPEVEEQSPAGEKTVQTVISIARDITELKQVESKLQESDKRFRSIIENSPDAFFLLRAVYGTEPETQRQVVDFIFEHMNQRGAELLTIPAADCIGKRLTEIMPGERPRQFIEQYARILASGKAAHEEYHVESPYVKGARWLHSLYVPIQDVLAVTTTDITSRMQTVVALQRSEERYRRLVEHASEAIFSADREGRFTYANPYIRDLGGFGDEDVSKYFFTDLIVASHRERVKRHFFRQYLSQTPYSYIEAPFTKRSGGVVWLAVTTSLNVHGSDVDGFDCIATDITEWKRIESELKDVRTNESKRVQEATDQLREKLRQPIERIRGVSRALAGLHATPELDDLANHLLLQADRAMAALDRRNGEVHD